MKSLRAGIPAFVLALAAVLPSSAWAKEVAVAPFIAKGGLDPLIALNITSLVSSELDFSSEYDGAVQLEEKPAGLSVACLSQAACLKKIGTATGKEHLVAGSVSPSGDEYELYMVLFNTSGGSFVRKKSFKVATTPEKMADSMTGVVSELVTGKSVKAEAQEEAVTDDFDMFDDDFDDFSFEEDDQVNTTIALPGNSSASLDDFEEEPDDWEMEERRREEEEARRRAEEDRRRAEEAERRRAEEEARRRADEERRRAEAERQAELDAEEDWDDISFGDASDEIEVEIDDIVFGDVTDEIVAEGDDDYSDDDYGYRDYDSYDRDSGSRSTRSSSSRAGDEDDYGYGSTSERSSSRSSRDRDYDSLDGDEDERSSRSSSRGERGSSSRSGSNVTIDTGSNDPRMGIALRGGYSHFQTLNFVTYGGGLKIPVADAAFIDVALAGYSTRRTVDVGAAAKQQICEDAPEDVRCTGEPVWNSIANFALGLSYQNTSRDFRPYIGGDLTLTPYTRSFNTALGLQARGGLDYMVTDSFGLNLNGTLGFWYGGQFPTIQEGMNPIGLTPSLSAGTVILF